MSFEEGFIELYWAFSFVFGIIGFIVAVAWIFLPFALYGIRGRLDRIIFLLAKKEQDNDT